MCLKSAFHFLFPAVLGLDYKSCSVLVGIEKQSQEIAEAVYINHKEEDIGAGDQGLMFGYATDETEELMPLTVVLAHGLNRKLAENRRNGTMPWLRPDSKTQVTVEYKMDGGACLPLRVHTVVISTQTDPCISLADIQKELLEKIVKVCYKCSIGIFRILRSITSRVMIKICFSCINILYSVPSFWIISYSKLQVINNYLIPSESKVSKLNDTVYYQCAHFGTGSCLFVPLVLEMCLY